MGRFLVLILSALLSLNAFSAVPSGTPSIGIGQASGVASPSFIGIDNPSGSNYAMFSLDTGDLGAAFTAGHFYPFFKNGAAYSVTTGKAAYCFNLAGEAQTASNYFAVMTATASFAYNAAAVSNEANWCGAAGKACRGTGSTAAAWVQHPGIYIFASPNIFPGVEGNAAAMAIHMDCYEK